MATKKSIKLTMGVCQYCGKELSYPSEGVEMVRTKRRDTFYFHTLCFCKNRKKVNSWM